VHMIDPLLFVVKRRPDGKGPAKIVTKTEEG
jgi:hypothetical protein